jgi:hypothetical protein
VTQSQLGSGRGRQKAQEAQNIPPAKHPKEEHFKKLKN